MLPPDYLTVNQNFSPIPQSYISKTTINSDNKEFLENFPVWQRNLHWVPNQYKIDPQFHIQYHIQFHIQCFNLSLDYLLLFGNFTHIPQIYTHRATNLAKNIFEEISPFSRKTDIVWKIWTKMVFLGFQSVTPSLCENQSKFQSYSTNPHTKHYHSD